MTRIGMSLDCYIKNRSAASEDIPAFSELPESVQSALCLIAAVQAQIVIFAGPDLLAFYNDAYAPTIGRKHPAAFGRPARDSWSELWDDLEPMLRHVLETGEPLSARDRPFYIERFEVPETVYFDISFSPIRNRLGQVDGVICVVSETTERVEAFANIDKSAARLSAIVEGATVGLATLDESGSLLLANERLGEILGVPLADLQGQRWNGLIQPEIQSSPLTMQELLARGVHEFRYLREDGSAVWLTQSIGALGPNLKLKGNSGAEEEYCLVVIDSTDRRRRDAKIRQQAAIIDGSDDAIISIDLNFNIMSWNNGASRLYGYDVAEVLGRKVTFLLPPGKRDEETLILGEVRDGRKVESYETSRLRKDGEEVPISLTVSPIFDENGVIIGASKIGRDISARKDTERLQVMLLREMKHRVKNILATVLAIARQTLGEVNRTDTQRFTQRVMALARAQDLLTREDNDGAFLHDLVREVISPYTPERFVCNGPAVALNSQAVMSLTLALHELATNAAKYGSLSVENGKVELTWEVTKAKPCADDASSGAQLLQVKWAEFGGPEVCAPTRRGFGTVLLRDVPAVELQAEISLNYHPSGLIYVARIPLAEITVPAGPSV